MSGASVGIPRHPIRFLVILPCRGSGVGLDEVGTVREVYHFTAEIFLPSIKKEGLTRGVMLKTIMPISFIPNRQWLTTNPEFAQSWSKGTGALPFKRNEVRLTIIIPTSYEENLKPWTQMQFLVPEVANALSAYGDPENWLIYSGDIPPKWIRKITKNPNVHKI